MRDFRRGWYLKRDPSIATVHSGRFIRSKSEAVPNYEKAHFTLVLCVCVLHGNLQMETRMAALSETKWQTYFTTLMSSRLNVSLSSLRASTVFTSVPARLSLRDRQSASMRSCSCKLNWYFDLILVDEGDVTSGESSMSFQLVRNFAIKDEPFPGQLDEDATDDLAQVLAGKEFLKAIVKDEQFLHVLCMVYRMMPDMLTWKSQQGVTFHPPAGQIQFS